MQFRLHKNYFVWIHLSFLVGAFILLYWRFFMYLAHTWVTNFDYRPGIIIPLLSFYMVWKRRKLLALISIKPSKSGILVIVFASLLYVGGQAAHVQLAQQLSFFTIIPGIILYYFGFRMLRYLSIPLVILVFMAPYAELFYPSLQLYVAQACVEVLQVIGAPVYLQAHYIQLPDLSVDVASGCLGFRLITAIFPIGLTIGFLYFNSRWKKIIMVLFSAILPIMANIFRIVSMLMFAIKGNESFITGTPHKTYGYVVFLAALLILFGFATLLNRFSWKPFSRKKQMMMTQNPLESSWIKGFSSYGNLVFVALMLLAPALVHARLLNQSATPLKQSFDTFPLNIDEWKGHELAENEWHPKIVSATDNLRRGYKGAGGSEIMAFVSYLPMQKQGREIVYHANQIIPTGYIKVNQNLKTWLINGNSPSFILKTKSVKLVRGMQHITLLYWYKSTKHYAHNQYIAKAFMALDSLLLNRSNGAVFVLIFKNSLHNSKVNDEKIQSFLNGFMPEISKYIPS